jgi:hypothetical protein
MAPMVPETPLGSVGTKFAPGRRKRRPGPLFGHLRALEFTSRGATLATPRTHPCTALAGAGAALRYTINE